jgi:hypothetical protein
MLSRLKSPVVIQKMKKNCPRKIRPRETPWTERIGKSNMAAFLKQGKCVQAELDITRPKVESSRV